MSCILPQLAIDFFSSTFALRIFRKDVFRRLDGCEPLLSCTTFCHLPSSRFWRLLLSSSLPYHTLLDLIHIHTKRILAYYTSQSHFCFNLLTYCAAGLKSTASVDVTRIVVPSFASMARVKKRRSKGRRLDQDTIATTFCPKQGLRVDPMTQMFEDLSFAKCASF